MTVDQLDGLPIFDVERLERLLWEEFSLFEAHFHVPDHQQDRRAWFLAWWAVFAPEAFSHELLSLMIDFHDSKVKVERPNWWELCRLETALFALTKDPDFLWYHRNNFGNGMSATRNLIKDCLCLVVKDLSFSDPLLLEQCECTVKAAHMGCEDNVILLLVAPGDLNKKRLFLDDIIEKHNGKPNTFEDLLFLQKHGYVTVSAFTDAFLYFQQYALIRLASQYSLPPGPEQLEFEFPELVPSEQLALEPPIPGNADKVGLTSPRLVRGTLDSRTIWERFSAHPFSKVYFYLK